MRPVGDVSSVQSTTGSILLVSLSCSFTSHSDGSAPPRYRTWTSIVIPKTKGCRLEMRFIFVPDCIETYIVERTINIVLLLTSSDRPRVGVALQEAGRGPLTKPYISYKLLIDYLKVLCCYCVFPL